MFWTRITFLDHVQVLIFELATVLVPNLILLITQVFLKKTSYALVGWTLLWEVCSYYVPTKKSYALDFGPNFWWLFCILHRKSYVTIFVAATCVANDKFMGAVHAARDTWQLLAPYCWQFLITGVWCVIVFVLWHRRHTLAHKMLMTMQRKVSFGSEYFTQTLIPPWSISFFLNG
jgi:hypothetical protein